MESGNENDQWEIPDNDHQVDIIQIKFVSLQHS